MGTCFAELAEDNSPYDDGSISRCSVPFWSNIDPEQLCNYDSSQIVFGPDGLLVRVYQCAYVRYSDGAILPKPLYRRHTIDVSKLLCLHLI